MSRHELVSADVTGRVLRSANAVPIGSDLLQRQARANGRAAFLEVNITRLRKGRDSLN
jgi:hypothetical protein